MSIFFRISLYYFLFATAITVALRDDFLFVGTRTLLRSFDLLNKSGQMLPLLIALFAVSYWTSKTLPEFLRRLKHAGIAALICCLFIASYTSIKSTMPLILDALGVARFFADPSLAWLDRALHFGVDPWRLTHQATQVAGLDGFAEIASVYYRTWWAIPALYFPALVLLLGEDRQTFLHYMKLYAFGWFVLGNVVALAASSAGPVYYARVVGTETFADLHVALSVAGLDGTWIGRVQEFLWESYTQEAQAVGSGLSAFPSLHLAATTMVAIYLGGKSRILGAFGWFFVLAILFASVWTGYHYAIDGYFSIAAVYVFHRYLLRSSAAKSVTSEIEAVSEAA